MIQVADNFNYRGKKPNFDRDSFDTLQSMKNYSDNNIDEGHISYCIETDKHYKYNSSNDIDSTTGKFRQFTEGILPDEEDITSNDNDKLKLADRKYNPEQFSGKGYKILRKNIQGGKNVLSQSMINQQNTIYEIRYDYDLNDQEITIPEGSTLKFNGGSLSNGTLINCSSIDGNKVFRNIKLDNSVNVDNLSDSIFGNDYIIVNNELELQQAIQHFNESNLNITIYIRNNIYSSGLNITNKINTLKIIGGKIIYSKQIINITKQNSETPTHYIVKLSSDYSIMDQFQSDNKLLYCGENDTYMLNDKMKAYNISSNIEIDNLYESVTNEDVYIRAKIDNDLYTKLGDLDVEDCRNLIFTYTSAWVNFYVNVHHISEGYLYFKNIINDSDVYNMYINGDWLHNTKARYKILNSIKLLTSDTICVDKNNNLYIPKYITNVYYTDKGSYIINGSSNLEIYNCEFFGGDIQINNSNNLTVESCTFSNCYQSIVVPANSSNKISIQNSNFTDIYKEGIFVSNGNDNCNIINNYFKNTGIIIYNDGASINVNSDNCYIYNNKIVNTYTGIRVGNTRSFSSYNISAGIYHNEIIIEEDFINGNNTLNDLGVIYIFTHQNGHNPLGDGTIVKENIIINKSSSNNANGIYFDDGAYNSSAIGNYIKGFSIGLTSRTVKSTSTPNNNLNKNNKFEYNIIIEGIIVIGGRTDKIDLPVVYSNIIFTKTKLINIFTNLNEQNNGVLLCNYYRLNGDTIYVPKSLISYLCSYIGLNSFISKKLLDIRTDREAGYLTKVELPVDCEFQYLNDSNISYKYVVTRFKLSYEDSKSITIYKLSINSDVFNLAGEVRTRYISDRWYVDFVPTSISTFINLIEYKIDNTYLYVRFSANTELLNSAFSSELYSKIWNQLLFGYCTAMKPTSTLQGKSDDSTDISYIQSYCFQQDALCMKVYYENEGDGEWKSLFNSSYYFSRNNNNIFIEGKDKAKLLLFSYSTAANPDVVYQFASKDLGIRKNISKFYFKDNNSLKYYNDGTVYNINGDIDNTRGTFAQKPTQGIQTGFAYFCTDKQTTEGSRDGIMIYYAGDNTWVDALGRIVS